MKRTTLFLLCAPFFLLTLSGCWFIIGGAVGAAGVYGASKDTVEGATDKSYESLWESALAICKVRGAIMVEDELRGEFEAKIDSSRVWVSLMRITQATTKLKVSARKFRFPNLSLAQDLYTKIIEQAQ